MKQLVIDESNAKKLYPKASDEMKAIFEDIFGKPFFAQKITDRVKTFEDACQVLGIDPDEFYSTNEESDEIAYKKLKVIIRALNEGWEPNWNNSNERKWWPWFYMNDKSGFRLHDVDCVLTHSIVGSRLVFKTEELGRYAATQFADLYKAFFTL